MLLHNFATSLRCRVLVLSYCIVCHIPSYTMWTMRGCSLCNGKKKKNTSLTVYLILLSGQYTIYCSNTSGNNTCLVAFMFMAQCLSWLSWLITHLKMSFSPFFTFLLPLYITDCPFRTKYSAVSGSAVMIIVIFTGNKIRSGIIRVVLIKSISLFT